MCGVSALTFGLLQTVLQFRPQRFPNLVRREVQLMKTVRPGGRTADAVDTTHLLFIQQQETRCGQLQQQQDEEEKEKLRQITATTQLLASAG